jgi:peptide/nickel transport system ATP-binding protein
MEDRPLEDTTAPPLLEVADLHVRFPTTHGLVHSVNGVSLEIRPGERVAVVGESGSGKSLTAMSVIGLVPNPGMVSGSIRFKGRELVGLSERKLVEVRRAGIGLIFQDAIASLDPLKRVGGQIEEALRMRTGMNRSQARHRALDLIEEVQIGDPDVRARQYAHELSGGMAQRVAIACALSLEPELLIADEPTSSLDATTAFGVLELISNLSRDHGLAVMLITHDLGIVARFAERVLVMCAGSVVEEAPVDVLFSHPRHPYTRGLLESRPGAQRGRRAKTIPGSAPDPTHLPSGCVFHPRCFLSQGRDRCRVEDPRLKVQGRDGAQHSACHFASELRPIAAIQPMYKPAALASASAEEGDLLAVEGISKTFRVRDRLFREGGVVRALNDVSFTVRRGEVLALVGESGSGKSTIGKIILGLESPLRGRVLFDGEDISSADRAKSLQRRLQVVFQNPDSSLDPRMKVEDIVAEPLKVHRIGSSSDRRRRVEELFEHVGLSDSHIGRYPFELSGGQRQRIAIARSLAPKPELIVCDEPVTALDVSVQAQILNLLQDVQITDRLSYLFVAHDLSIVRQIADRVAVMYLGHIVESGEAEEFFALPHHPYSVALLSAMSGFDPETERRRRPIVLSGAMPSSLSPPPACPFHTRCWKAEPVCRELMPELREITPGRWTACHYPENASNEQQSLQASIAASAGRTLVEPPRRV